MPCDNAEVAQAAEFVVQGETPRGWTLVAEGSQRSLLRSPNGRHYKVPNTFSLSDHSGLPRVRVAQRRGDPPREDTMSDKTEFDFCMSLDAEDEPDALTKALAAARCAIHVAGGATPGWEGTFEAIQQIVRKEPAAA